MFCISFGLSTIYASFVLISRLPTATTSHDKTIEVEDSPQLQLVPHASHLRGLADSISPQQQDDNIHEVIQQTAYWNVTSWLDFVAMNQPHLLTSSAKQSNYMCSTNPTSINTTIAAAVSDDMLSVSLSPSNLSKLWPMTKDYLPIYINFRAYDKITRPQNNGGDVFVLEYQSWSSSSIGNTTVKSATFTNDNLDGTYSATLFLPRSMPIDHLDVTLRHYYTCHQGLKRPVELKNCGDICQLDFGPTVWPQLGDAILKEVGKSSADYPSKEVEVGHRCTSFDEVLFGVWKEEGIYPNLMSTKGADWYPIYCNLEKEKLPPLRGKEFNIGDSTMPYRIAEVGYPYSPHRGDKHDIAYAEALWNTLRNANEHDIVVFGGGLHHLYHMNFNPQSIAKLLIKSMCQIGLVFPSDEEILLRGPNTIQQHLNNRVDQTALNARMINWELRSMLIRHDYKLESLCEYTMYTITSSDGINISSLAHLADDMGNIMSDADTVTLLKNRHNFNESQYNSTQVALSRHLENLSASDRKSLYRNRTIRWIDTEMFMLPRQEEYRPNDKVHDKVEFFFHKHAQLYGHLERISNRDRLEQ